MRGSLRRTTDKPSVCELCSREFPLSFHHVIPKLTHKRRWVRQQFSAEELQRGIWVCAPCHSAIHRFIDHLELAQNYNTIEALLAHEELGRFVRWSQKQSKKKKVSRKR